MKFQRKPVYGVGINDVFDECFTSEKRPKYYDTWKSMMQRCYSNKKDIIYPTYINCEVDKKWIYLSNFKEWFNKNYIDGYHLDKDLLFPGNKIYGPDKCVFVPNNINALLIFRNKNRGKYPLGVGHYNYCGKTNPYRSRCSDGKGNPIYKSFSTPEKAHFWYLEQKINVIDNYLQENYSDKIKDGLIRWRDLFQYHINNQIIFDPNNEV